MRPYRADLVTDENHIIGPPEIVMAEDDDRALAKAAELARRRVMKNAKRIEVWDEGRKLGEIPIPG